MAEIAQADVRPAETAQQPLKVTAEQLGVNQGYARPIFCHMFLTGHFHVDGWHVQLLLSLLLCTLAYGVEEGCYAKLVVSHVLLLKVKLCLQRVGRASHQLLTSQGGV